MPLVSSALLSSVSYVWLSSYLRMVLLALKPLLTSCWPPIHHLEAFSSAMRGESYGGHHHEMERPEETRMLVGLWLQE